MTRHWFVDTGKHKTQVSCQVFHLRYERQYGFNPVRYISGQNDLILYIIHCYCQYADSHVLIFLRGVMAGCVTFGGAALVGLPRLVVELEPEPDIVNPVTQNMNHCQH